MRTKFILPVLAGLALASCSQDEELVSIQQTGNFSPVTFTVGLDENGGATRGDWNSDNDQISFNLQDLMSLYNGYEQRTGTNPIKYTFSNAVFAGAMENGELVYKTQALVQKGQAIMVFPADTSFQNIEQIEIKAKLDGSTIVQKKDDNKYLPFVSDYFTISEYAVSGIPTGKPNSAGYGRRYDVPVRMLGGRIVVTLKPQNESLLTANNVTDFKYLGTTIDAGAEVLTSVATITPSTSNSQVAENAKAKLGGGDETLAKYDHFYNGKGKQIKVTTKNDEAQKIYSEDVDNTNKLVYFNLLPQMTDLNLTSTSMIVKTNYGTVTVTSAATGEEGESPLQGVSNKNYKTMNEALSAMLNNFDSSVGKNGTYYKGEQMGFYTGRHFEFDLKNLDMSNLEIESSQHLINALTVYEALGRTNQAYTWTLKPEANMNGGVANQFVMTNKALNKLANHVSKITLVDGTNTILLDSRDDVTDLTNFNKIIFSDGKANVKLAGTWTMNQTQKFDKVENLTIAANLSLKGEGNGTAVANFGSTLTSLTLTGTLNITEGNAYVNALTAKRGSNINISAGTKYYADGATLFEGARVNGSGATVTNYGVLTANTSATITNQGIINNYGELSTVQHASTSAQNGVFNNSGVITNQDAKACMIYLTANETSTNKGRIILKNRNDEVKIQGAAGYIQYSMDADAAGLKVADEDGDKFNYLVINVKADLADVDLNGLAVNTEKISAVQYLRINGERANVIRTVNHIKFTDLIVNSMRYLSSNKNMRGINTYVKTEIVHAGNYLYDTKGAVYNSTTLTEANEGDFNGEIRKN